jgi:DNA-binding transcriptional LysR family regulator
MEIKQLRYFKAVAEELHFQRAARRVHITQPALSHQMQRLEDELGVVLLVRDRKNVTLSEAGKVFLSHVRDILARLDQAVQATQDAAGLEPTTLRIGTSAYLNLAVIARSIVAARVAASNFTIEQIEMPTNEVYHALKEGQIDIGFAPLPATHASLVVKKVVDGFWTIVVPENHELAIDDEIPIKVLEDKPLIIFDKALNPQLYDRCMGLFDTAGFKPRIVLETKQVQTALRMVSERMALYFVASYVIADLPPGLVYRKLLGFDNKISIGAVWHEANLSKSLKAYLQYLRKEV